MNRRWIALLVTTLAFAGSGGYAADVIFSAGFENGSSEDFSCDFEGACIRQVEASGSVGNGALRCQGVPTVDVEHLMHFTDHETRVAFHYYSHGYPIIRVLGWVVDERENYYFNITNAVQDQWAETVVRVADFRNVIPRHGVPDKPFGDRTGKGKTFRNIVLHLMTGTQTNVPAPFALLDNLVLYSGEDHTPPVMRGTLRINLDDKGGFLSWPDAHDDVGVAYYKVYGGHAPDFAVTDTALLGTTVVPEFALSHSNGFFQVVAVDFGGNCSAPQLAKLAEATTALHSAIPAAMEQPAAPAPKTGTLVVGCPLGATVTMDGQAYQHGFSEPLIWGRIAIGKHTVRVQFSGQDRLQTVEVLENRTVSIAEIDPEVAQKEKLARQAEQTKAIENFMNGTKNGMP